MKTLLLSLMGIVVTSSSSIIPVAMMKNHQNINQIESAKKELTKEFSYDIYTKDIKKIISSRHIFEDFGIFYGELKKFLKDNKIKNWTVSSISTQFKAIDRKVKNLSSDSDLNNLLHKMVNSSKFNEIEHSLLIDGHLYEEKKWTCVQQLFVSIDGKRYRIDNIGAYSSDSVFTEEQIYSGLNQTFTISYESDTDVSDISGPILEVAGMTNFNYHDQTLDSFKTDFVPKYASKQLNQNGINIKPEWLSFKSSTLIETNESISEQLITGDLGAGEYELEITVTVNKLGNENNFVGERAFHLKINFNYGDLSKFDGSKFNSEDILSSYETLGAYIDKQIKQKLYTTENCFYFINLDCQHFLGHFLYRHLSSELNWC